MFDTRKKRIKKTIIILVLINSIAAFVLLAKTGILKNVIGPQSAIAAEETTEDSETSAADKGTDEAASGEEKKELTDEEKAAKQAEETKIVLDGLEAKRLQLKEQEEGIVREQEKVKILKKELEEKIAELEKIHRQINLSLEKLNKKKSERELRKQAAEAKKIKQLVKVYSSMKPKNAGQIINTMDIIVAEKIIRSMKGDAAGKILSYVESSRAAAISERLASTIGRPND